MKSFLNTFTGGFARKFAI